MSDQQRKHQIVQELSRLKREFAQRQNDARPISHSVTHAFRARIARYEQSLSAL